MPRLGVNVDHVATIRQARRAEYPDPVEAARVAEAAGADSITAHLREDRRHIRDDDVVRLAAAVRTKLNLELSVSEEIVLIAVRLRPAAACLVPERREEVTTEGGLDVVRHAGRVQDVVRRLADAGVRVSLFVDPEPAQLEAATRVGAPVVELHTGDYANAAGGDAVARELARLHGAARAADALGLQVNAGHGLTVANVGPVARLPHMDELNIGHSIVARAVIVGMAEAVREMKRAIAGG